MIGSSKFSCDLRQSASPLFPFCLTWLQLSEIQLGHLVFDTDYVPSVYRMHLHVRLLSHRCSYDIQNWQSLRQGPRLRDNVQRRRALSTEVAKRMLKNDSGERSKLAGDLNEWPTKSSPLRDQAEYPKVQDLFGTLREQTKYLSKGLMTASWLRSERGPRPY